MLLKESTGCYQHIIRTHVQDLAGGGQGKFPGGSDILVETWVEVRQAKRCGETVSMAGGTAFEKPRGEKELTGFRPVRVYSRPSPLDSAGESSPTAPR